MGRWKKRSSQLNNDEESSQTPPTLEEFLESNHRLFTAVSIFAALAVYLTRFQNSLTDATKSAVGAVLVLFLLASFLLLKKSYRHAEQATGIESPIRLIGYSIFTSSFFILAVSVLLLIAEKYSIGARSVLGSGLLYSIIFMYFPFIMNKETFAEYEGSYLTEILVLYAPYISLVLMLIWTGIRIESGNLALANFTRFSFAIGVVTAMIAIHFISLVVILLSAMFIDKYLLD